MFPRFAPIEVPSAHVGAVGVSSIAGCFGGGGSAVFGGSMLELSVLGGSSSSLARVKAE